MQSSSGMHPGSRSSLCRLSRNALLVIIFLPAISATRL